MKRDGIVYARTFSAFVAAVFFCACQEIEDMGRQPHQVGFYAGGSQTRTTMLDDGLSAVWSANDELALWARNSSGAYTLSNQIFKVYGLDAGRGFFTSTLSEQMPEDTYTYAACYPVPVAVTGSKVTFTVPSVQDGKASSGADIMISDPVRHGPLTGIPEPEDHSGLRMKMNHMMHQFRFFVPEDDQLLGDEKIERILLTFPKGVTGNVTLDVENPDVSVELTDAQTEVELRLAQPIGVSSGDDYEFACLAFAPVQFEQGQMLQLKAYTDDKIVYIDDIDLKGKTCEAGHSTPVKLKIREVVDYTGIIHLNLATNNLGENPRKITLTAPEGCNWGDGGSNVFVYDPGREIETGETIAIKFETDVDAYMAFSNQEISVTYDSENALMSETLTMPVIESSGITTVSMTVPYLLFEDFSCIHSECESYGNNSYASSDRNQPGVSLDDYMNHKGWNAARFWAKPSTSVRINTRYQSAVGFASYHHGRLDTPAIGSIKNGKAVKVRVVFNAGGYLHTSSSASVSNSAISVAMHTKSGKLDGIPTGKSGMFQDFSTTLADFGTTYDTFDVSNEFGEDTFGVEYPKYELIIDSMTSSSRLCFYLTFTGSANWGTGNAEFNVYIDNVRVQIAK